MADRPATPADLVWSDGPIPPMSEQRLALFRSGSAYASIETCWWGTDCLDDAGWMGCDDNMESLVRVQPGETGWWWAWLGTMNLDGDKD